MSTPEEDAVIAAAEQIGRIAMSDINLDEYQAILFGAGAMLAVFRSAMTSTGYSEYLVELTAWMIMTSFFGHHLSNKEIFFDPPAGTYAAPKSVSGRSEGDDQGGEGAVHGSEGVA